MISPSAGEEEFIAFIMAFKSIPIWKEAPFVRLITPVIAGILLEWHVGLLLSTYEYLVIISLILMLVFAFLKSVTRFRKYWLSGIFINVLFVNIGGLMTYFNDERHDPTCITTIGGKAGMFVVTLDECLSEKEKSFKANAVVNQVFDRGTSKTGKGKIIIYFQKDSALQTLTYGSRIYFNKSLQPIRNTGNPGAFDYQRYCLFQQIYYQVYLKAGDYTVIPNDDVHWFIKKLIDTRMAIVTILKTFISGELESGLAEALLIGYKDDLDKNLVQSYSNTGVVHIIAISGLHLGLIYWLLNLLLTPFKVKGKFKWIKAVLIISGLWLFSLLTGGSASVCRSALMFSFIVTGKNIGRKSNIYNSLAASAFLLLCYNPFWLWDAGFQLSYIAVLSIVVFMKPIYNWFYIKNKLLDNLWKMASISIAAQILTTPISIFHFQQFPNYFLITNIVAVPLSSAVVLAEIALCTISFVPGLAMMDGRIICWLITLMDDFIDYINKMPFTVTTALNLSMTELILLYVLIVLICNWLFHKNKKALLFALAVLTGLTVSKTISYFQLSSQEQLIIYDSPRHQCIDLIKGRECLFIGDSELFNNPGFQNYILKPSRNKFGIDTAKKIRELAEVIKEFNISQKHIVLINSSASLPLTQLNDAADIVILSGNPQVSVAKIRTITRSSKIIADCSNSQRVVDKWKADCMELGVAFYSVSENGAFILKPN